MDWLLDPKAWLELLTLSVLTVVLSVDNIIFISILAGKLPPRDQRQGRRIGLIGAFATRLILLLAISWIVRLTAPLFAVLGREISGRDIILISGGLFLIAKATYEIHDKLEGGEGETTTRTASSLLSVVAQIMVIDIVFSLDSVVTAVGMATHLPVMVAANVVALGVMLLAAGPTSHFVERHPTVKMLALAFLLLIGTNLVAEGLGVEIPKGYTYFAMFFSVGVEALNLRLRAKHAPPVRLHHVPHLDETQAG